MKLTPIIAALRARCPSLSQRVQGAAVIPPLSDLAPATLPVAYVIPAADQPAQQQSQTDYWQTLGEGFSVIVVTSCTAESLASGAALDTIDALRSELWLALLGFNPETENGEVLVYSAGQLLEADSARIAYQFTFSRQRTLSADDSRIAAEMAQLDDLNTIAIDINTLSPGNGPDNLTEHHSQITFSE